jgi:hypothetical protein
MTEKLIEYIDDTAPEYDRVHYTRPMRSLTNAANTQAERLGTFQPAAAQREPQPRVCPYGACENIEVFDSRMQRIAKPLGYLPPDSSGRAKRCQCLLDRIEASKSKAKPAAVSSGKLFQREFYPDESEIL